MRFPDGAPSLVKKINSEPISQEGVEYVTELPADF